MRELTADAKHILAQHKLWVESHGGQGRRADLGGADLREANLREANLREANLYGANLYGANLRMVNLRRADLSRADLRRANLSRADLYGANLYMANLREADLYGANLSRADLYGANLYGANLREADLSEAKGIRVITPDGSRGDMLKATIHADGWHIYTGCFGGTLAEFEAAVERDHANDKWGILCSADIAMLRATEQVFLDEMREWEVNRG